MMAGNQKVDAKMLVGDALYKEGEFTRAKQFYIVVRGLVQGDKKAAATKKIALCNAELHLPERLPVSVPSELLHQRPDILAAEASVRASAESASSTGGVSS